ncbi:hypothetical protein HS088_TW15G00873 [Tripterygium wilfordii]|uniref:NB-ARC domain-containing protein n=2 Tax=Tripterygium wilfordii TaxID=458696 RepID=A0A7J7CMV9_TRIWF|nr:hypothetical protein HS088_TW15G00873 [Tripterygium wilfordii]
MDRRSLFIFDCITTNYVRDALRSLLNSTSNRMRIIFIVPHACVNQQVDERSFIYKLHLRSDDETWALFTHTLKVSIPAELLKLKSKILRTCGGLPKVIVELAGILSHTTMEEWSTVLEQLNQDEEPWSEPLHEIYKNMPLYLRRCLFYFGLFPKDFNIPARRLIVLWVAEGLGWKENIDEPPEQVSESCLEELVSQNVVQVTKEANFLQGHSSPRTSIVRRVADHLDSRDGTFDVIHRENKPSSSMYSCSREVISFLSFDTRDGSKPGQEIGDFLELCISRKCLFDLQVLDLEHVFQPKLPETTAKLTRLKYLGLRWTCLKKLPSFICKLLNLQTLDLKRTSIDTLPSSIWLMEKLRHLYLDKRNSCRFVCRPNGRSFMDLWTLWGLFVDEESPVKDGLDTIMNIRKLGLACRLMSSRQEAMFSQLEAVANWVQKLEHLQRLRLKSYDQSNQPWELPLKSLSGHSCLTSIYLVGKLKYQSIVSEFPQKIIEITLSASGLTEDPMQMLDKLPNLKFLRLLSKSYTRETMLCSAKGFPELRVLKLWELESLEDWNMQEGAMPRLKDLEIRSCKNLRNLPNGLQYMSTLYLFKLSKMPRELIDKIKDDQGIEHAKIAHIRNVFIKD